MKKINDTKRLDFLEKLFGAGLINDDNGHWAISEDGMQNVVSGKKTQDVQTTFFIEAKDWKKSIRKAIDEKMKELN